MSRFSRLRLLIGLSLLVAHPASAAAPPFLIADINLAGQEGRLPAGGELTMTTLGGFTYFQGHDGRNGLELWRTDGTAAGTTMVADICPGACSSLPSGLAAVGSQLFFVADDGIHGTELWASDGTTGGTRMVEEIQPGLLGASLGNLTAHGSLTLFVRITLDFPGSTREIWRSDGTAAGTFPLLTGIANNLARPNTYFLGAAGGKTLFASHDPAHGIELWATDGTVGGTMLLEDVFPGALNGLGFPGSAIGADGRVYFVADDGPHGPEIWASDGTAAGTQLVVEVTPGNPTSPPDLLTRLGSLIVFRQFGTTGFQLWRTDGSGPGTFALTDQNEGFPTVLASAGSKLFFYNNGGATQTGFWVTDGSVAGTERLLFTSGAAQGPWIGTVGSLALFYWTSPAEGFELWASDGTPGGTAALADINPGLEGSRYSHHGSVPSGGGLLPDRPAALGSRLIFGAFAGSTGNGLWASDGTPGGTVEVRDLDLQTSSLPWEAVLPAGEAFAGKLTPLAGQLLLHASGGATGRELWVSDGSTAGTLIVTDLTPGTGATALPALVPLDGGSAVFPFTTVAEGTEPWITDGSALGTVLIEDLIPGPEGSTPDQLASTGPMAFFRAGSAQSTLAMTDGLTIDPLETDVFVLENLTAGDGFLFYSDFDLGNSVDRIWRRTGAGAPTLMTPSALAPFSPFLLTPAGGGRLFFVGFDTGGGEPWWAEGDGSPAFRLADIRPGAEHGLPIERGPVSVARAGSRVYFGANDGLHGLELWATDGTPAGTVMVANLNPGAAGSEPTQLVGSDDRLFFVADDGTHGREVWSIPAAGAAPVLLADVVAGAGSSVPQDLASDAGRAYWSAWTPLFGRELFASDGTPGGTGIVADLAPGAGSSSPAGFTRFGPRLYFGANDGSHGVELWALPVEAIFADGFESGNTSAWSLTVP
ncbi:MAG TPA: ELWxxDGT repeat protein [Thermoanaerobaculia bacterium]|nr:ELWxxDGT repeat protein [Thermoanaerobaculia bacterium]